MRVRVGVRAIVRASMPVHVIVACSDDVSLHVFAHAMSSAHAACFTSLQNLTLSAHARAMATYCSIAIAFCEASAITCCPCRTCSRTDMLPSPPAQLVHRTPWTTPRVSRICCGAPRLSHRMAPLPCTHRVRALGRSLNYVVAAAAICPGSSILAPSSLVRYSITWLQGSMSRFPHPAHAVCANTNSCCAPPFSPLICNVERVQQEFTLKLAPFVEVTSRGYAVPIGVAWVSLAPIASPQSDGLVTSLAS